MTDVMRSVAINVRRIRTGRGLSLNELSRQAGVAKATLSQLELGRGNPTIETLTSLASHLGVTLTDLITAEASPPARVVRADEGTTLRGDGIDLRLVHRMTGGTTMYEVYDMRIRQGVHASPPHGVGVLEHLYIHEGSVLVGPRGELVRLDAGDFIAFSADQPHMYEGLSPTTLATAIVLRPTGAPSLK